jgi:osmoprotectant transport system substrate-binding protein
LAEIYAAALAPHKVHATTKVVDSSGGPRKALRSGSVDFVPAYSGEELIAVSPNSAERAPNDVYRALGTHLHKDKISLLDRSSAQFGPAVAVTRTTADKYHLTSLRDLSKAATRLSFGATSTFQKSPAGLPSLDHEYRLRFARSVTLADSGGRAAQSLRKGAVDVAVLSAADPAIVLDGFVTLRDPSAALLAQNLVPLVGHGVFDRLPKDAIAACNTVTAKLSTVVLASLLTKLGDGKQSPRDVARDWLDTLNLD